MHVRQAVLVKTMNPARNIVDPVRNLLEPTHFARALQAPAAPQPVEIAAGIERRSIPINARLKSEEEWFGHRSPMGITSVSWLMRRLSTSCAMMACGCPAMNS